MRCEKNKRVLVVLVGLQYQKKKKKRGEVQSAVRVARSGRRKEEPGKHWACLSPAPHVLSSPEVGGEGKSLVKMGHVCRQHLMFPVLQK